MFLADVLAVHYEDEAYMDKNNKFHLNDAGLLGFILYKGNILKKVAGKSELSATVVKKKRINGRNKGKVTIVEI